MGEDINSTETILKVRNSSNANSLASAISHGIYDGKTVYLRAIGAGAVNQSVKAMAIAQSFVAQKGISLTFRPGFTNVEVADGTITAMLFKVLRS